MFKHQGIRGTVPLVFADAITDGREMYGHLASRKAVSLLRADVSTENLQSLPSLELSSTGECGRGGRKSQHSDRLKRHPGARGYPPYPQSFRHVEYSSHPLCTITSGYCCEPNHLDRLQSASKMTGSAVKFECLSDQQVMFSSISNTIKIFDGLKIKSCW